MTKVVNIIGGGPAGFAAARALVSEPYDFRINIFERRKHPGGVWEYTGEGPMYERLDTNIYKELMEYKQTPFPSHLPRFLDRFDVLKYVENYSHLVADHDAITVFWDTEVTSLTKVKGQWAFTFDRDDIEPSASDFVIIATGHYETPFYPNVPGLSELRKSSPELVTHSKFYISPQPYKNKKILVIGNGSSGVDISIQLLSVTEQLYISRRHEAAADQIFDENVDVVWKPEAIKVDEHGNVTFEDQSVERFEVILCSTGYLYKLPFIERNESSKLAVALIDPSGARIRNLYKYIFFIDDPALAFVGLNKQVVPMPLSESQGAVIARIFSGRLQLPSAAEMREDEKRTVERKGSGSKYFNLGYPADVEYMHMLNDWADRSGQGGFFAERWAEDKSQMRKEIGEVKLREYARKKKEAVAERTLQSKPGKS
uniref:Monooxygenase B n=1 Tax=Starmerella bombicola TaxID=75736 RepID=A0A0A7RBA7_STABO|nr:monooxygenase B [Starmerella bombicola]